MASSSNPIDCLLCNTTGVLPSPLPTPTQQPFAFIAVPDPLTCDPATFSWSYNGPREQFMLVVSQAHPFKIQSLARISRVRRGTTSFLIADGLEATDLTFTWPIVNVPTGSYVLQAAGTGFSAMSSEFFVGLGINTSCLDALPPPAPSFTSSTSISTIPTSELFITTAYTGMPGGATPLPSVMSLNSSPSAADTKQTDAIVGGLVGAAVLLAAAFAVYRIRQRRTPVLRLPIFSRRARKCSQQGSGTTSRSLPIAPVSPVDYEKAGHDRPQPAIMSPVSPSAASTSSVSDAGEPTPAMDSEVESQRSIALAALNRNATALPARSPTSPLSPYSASESGSSIRTQRPRYMHTPAALNLSTPSSSARSQQSSFASALAATSPVPSSATSQMYGVLRESGRSSQWVTVGSPAEGEETGTTIVQAQRAIMTAGEMRAVRRDFPETPFPLSPDYR